MTAERFTGKVVLVTGSSRGIGAAIARRVAAEGASVAINYRSGQEAADALAAELSGQGTPAKAFQADVSDPAQIRGLLDAVVAEFGSVHAVASNAGIEHFGALEDITPEDFDRVFHVNVRGQLLVAQAAAAVLARGGRIVLTSSVSARIAVYHHALYAASKAAVSAMALNLAPELAERGITINAIAPGGTNTDMAAENAAAYTPPSLADLDGDRLLRAQIALGRLAEPEEIAAVVAFLLSDDASYLTGATLDASGGMT